MDKVESRRRVFPSRVGHPGEEKFKVDLHGVFSPHTWTPHERLDTTSAKHAWYYQHIRPLWGELTPVASQRATPKKRARGMHHFLIIEVYIMSATIAKPKVPGDFSIERRSKIF
jgi:hypothetical protein